MTVNTIVSVLIIVYIPGHHASDEIDVLDFTSLIQKHGFSFYMNGHTHTLTRYTVDNKGNVLSQYLYISNWYGMQVFTSLLVLVLWLQL